jgi:hypothetical protein
VLTPPYTFSCLSTENPYCAYSGSATIDPAPLDGCTQSCGNVCTPVTTCSPVTTCTPVQTCHPVTTQSCVTEP